MGIMNQALKMEIFFYPSLCSRKDRLKKYNTSSIYFKEIKNNNVKTGTSPYFL